MLKYLDKSSQRCTPDHDDNKVEKSLTFNLFWEKYSLIRVYRLQCSLRKRLTRGNLYKSSHRTFEIC